MNIWHSHQKTRWNLKYFQVNKYKYSWNFEIQSNPLFSIKPHCIHLKTNIKYQPLESLQILLANIGNSVDKSQGSKQICQGQWTLWDMSTNSSIWLIFGFCLSVYCWKCWTSDCTIPCTIDHLLMVVQRQEGRLIIQCVYAPWCLLLVVAVNTC